jgi:hypothetical protein
MLRYLILIGALAAMPLSSFAAAKSVDKQAAEPTANIEQGKNDGPVWVVQGSKTTPNEGPVWVVMKPKGNKTVS